MNRLAFLNMYSRPKYSIDTHCSSEAGKMKLTALSVEGARGIIDKKLCSATAEKQRVGCSCMMGKLTDRAMH